MKTALITGGSRGIGAACVRAFRQAGWQTAFFYRQSREAAEALEDRKRQARIQGEQASSKLIFPMLLQLVIVLTILMFPAFLSFY